ncbi:MAG TPA: DUF6069 family protein [Acidimicrobiales bacterium]|nr:DUF6069 family protein [Acidimicrobiales bacterium]
MPTSTPSVTLPKAGAAIAAAVAVNAAVFAAARAIGEDFVVVKDGSATTVTASSVVMMTIASLLVGFGAAAVTTRFWPAGLRLAVPVGAALTVLSLTLLPSADAPAATKLWITALHVVVGAAYVAALLIPDRTHRPLWHTGRA